MSVKPRQSRAIKRMELIKNAATDIIVEKGFEAVSTTSIADKAGIPVGSIYQYFGDKKAILRELYHASFAEVMEKQQEEFAKIGVIENWEESIKEMILHFWVLAKNHPTFKILTDWHNSNNPLRVTTPSSGQGLYAMVEFVIEKYDFELPAARHETIILTITSAVSIMVDIAVAEENEKRAEALIQEIPALVAGYLAPFKS